MVSAEEVERSLILWTFKAIANTLQLNLSISCDRKRGVKDNAMFLTYATGRMEWPLPEMEKTAGGKSVEKVIGCLNWGHVNPGCE